MSVVEYNPPEPEFVDFEEEDKKNIVPHSISAEEALLGCVLINPDALWDAESLSPDDFYIHRNKYVWEAFQTLNSQNAPIDILTVSEELDRKGLISEVGSSYITKLIGNVPSSLNAGYYAKIIESHSVRRKMVAAANRIAQAAFDEGLTIEEAREIANREITQVQTDNISEESAFSDSVSKVYDRAFENAERLNRGEKVKVGIKTGLQDLDKILLGIEDEESVIIAGRPGQGKTSILFDIARYNVIKEKKNVAIFSLEMSNEEVARRFISQEAEVDSNKIKTGNLNAAEWERVNNAIEKLESGGMIFLFDVANLTPAQMRTKCLKVKRRFGLDLVLLDYIQLMSAGMKTENRTREVGVISRQIKLLVKELKCPIFSAAQMSRAVEQRQEKRPVLSDLRDSGDLEQDANCVIFLHRQDQYSSDNNTTECIIAKRRDGQVGTVELIYRREYTTFASKTYRFAPNDDEVRHAINSSVGSED